MTSTNSTLIFIAMLSALLNGCASVNPNCAPVSTNYPDIAKDETKYYRVKKDDTLYAISLLFDLDYRQLAQWNQIAPPSYTIEIGQKIRLSDPIWRNKVTQDYMDAEGTTPRMGAVESRPEQRSRAPKVGVLGDAGAVADDSRDGGGRATHGAVADDSRDGGGRATHGAVAETKQKTVAATKIISSQKKATTSLNKPNLTYRPSYKTQAFKNTAEKWK